MAMSALSDYTENALLNHVLRNQAMTSPTTVYVALFTADPTDADSGTEVPDVDGSSNATAYARQSAAFDVPSNGATANSADILFPEATADWGTITHVGIYDGNTGTDNLLFHGQLTSAKTIETGDQFKIAAGDLDVTLA
jgi:hypothetical protein